MEQFPGAQFYRKSLISDTVFAMKADHTRGLNIPTGGP